MKYFLLLAAATFVYAQNTEPALRARASKFLQAYLDGKARNMEPMVAEDSKDVWFAAEKPRYISAEITNIEIDSSGSKAKVNALVQSTMQIRGNSFTIKIPSVWNWKVEEGEWRYFIDPNAKEREARKVRIPELKELLGKVTASKSEIKLCGCGEPEFEIGIKNEMPGQVTLSLEPLSVPGLRVSLKDAVLAANRATKIILEYDGAEKPPATPVPLVVNIEPTGEQLVIKLVFGTTN